MHGMKVGKQQQQQAAAAAAAAVAATKVSGTYLSKVLSRMCT